MMRIGVVLACLVVAIGCNKPSEADCKKALANMRVLLKTDTSLENVDVNQDIRRCKGGSKKKAVACAIAAQTLDDLGKCDFMKVPDKKPDAPAPAPGSGSAAAPGSGSASVPAGSGSAPAGSGSGA